MLTLIHRLETEDLTEETRSELFGNLRQQVTEMSERVNTLTEELRSFRDRETRGALLEKTTHGYSLPFKRCFFTIAGRIVGRKTSIEASATTEGASPITYQMVKGWQKAGIVPARYGDQVAILVFPIHPPSAPRRAWTLEEKAKLRERYIANPDHTNVELAEWCTAEFGRAHQR